MRSNIPRGGKTVDRQLLENALAQSQGLSQFAMSSDNFGGGRAGAFGAIAQGITAGLGAYAQYRNQQKLAELNATDAEAFAQFATQKGNPELASVASRLSPESREAYYLSMVLPQSQNTNIPSSIREFEYFNKLSPEQRAQYLNVKRDTVGQGAYLTPTGDVKTFTGYGDAPAIKTGKEQTAKNISDLNYKPAIEGKTTYEKEKSQEDVKAQEKINTVYAQADAVDNVLKQLETHPGTPDIFGAKGGGAVLSYLGKEEPIAGSNAAGAKAIYDQLQGQQFLQAFESIKGGGNISVSEGQAATKALSSINTSTSEKDLRKNIKILRDTISLAKKRASERASKGYQKGTTQPEQNIEKSVLLPPAGNQGQPNIKFLGFE